VNKLFIIVELLFVLSLGLVAQTTVNQTTLQANPEGLGNTQLTVYGVNSFDVRKFKTEGSPYLDNVWLNGDVKLYDGKLLDNVPYRYNVVNETLVINIEDVYYTLPNSVFTQFSAVQISDLGKVNNRNFIRIANTDNTSSYYEILQSDGTVSLALDHQAKLIKANYNTALDTGSPVDKYVQDQEHVLIIGDQVIRLKGSNKKILAQISDQTLVSYIKQNDVSLKDVEEVINMINNYKS